MDRLLHTPQSDRPADDHSANQMTLSQAAVVDIVSVERLPGYRLKLDFSDGAERILDFEPFLSASPNPLIREYLNPERFGEFRLEHGDLVWGDYGLNFPIADLYEGRL